MRDSELPSWVKPRDFGVDGVMDINLHCRAPDSRAIRLVDEGSWLPPAKALQRTV